jgi:hypothetical protein
MNLWGTVPYLSVTNALPHGITGGLKNNSATSMISYRALATRTDSIASPSAITQLPDTA